MASFDNLDLSSFSPRTRAARSLALEPDLNIATPLEIELAHDAAIEEGSFNFQVERDEFLMNAVDTVGGALGITREAAREQVEDAFMGDLFDQTKAVIGMKAAGGGNERVAELVENITAGIESGEMAKPENWDELRAEYDRVNSLPEKEKRLASRKLRAQMRAEIMGRASLWQNLRYGAGSWLASPEYNTEKALTAALTIGTGFAPALALGYRAMRGGRAAATISKAAAEGTSATVRVGRPLLTGKKAVAAEIAGIGAAEAAIVAPDAIEQAFVEGDLAAAEGAEQEYINEIHRQALTDISIGFLAGAGLTGLLHGARFLWAKDVDSVSAATPNPRGRPPPVEPTATTITIAPAKDPGGAAIATAGGRKIMREIEPGATAAEGEAERVTYPKVAIVSTEVFDEVIGDASGAKLTRYEEDGAAALVEISGQKRVVPLTPRKPSEPGTPDEMPPDRPMSGPEYQAKTAQRLNRAEQDVPDGDGTETDLTLSATPDESEFIIGSQSFTTKLSDEGRQKLATVQEMFERQMGGSNEAMPAEVFGVKDGRLVFKQNVPDAVKNAYRRLFARGRSLPTTKAGENVMRKLLNGEKVGGNDLASPTPGGAGQVATEGFAANVDNIAQVYANNNRATAGEAAAKILETWTFHGARRRLNAARIPPGHFSMLDEVYDKLIAPLEAQGFELPPSLIPDISTGLLFNKFLRKAGIKRDFQTYMHRFVDGRAEQEAFLYPNELREMFLDYLDTDWIPTQAKRYLGERYPKALAAMQARPRGGYPPLPEWYQGRVSQYGDVAVKRAIAAHGENAGAYFDMLDALPQARRDITDNTPVAKGNVDYAFRSGADTETRLEALAKLDEVSAKLPDEKMTDGARRYILANKDKDADTLSRTIDGTLDPNKPVTVGADGNIKGTNAGGTETTMQNTRVVKNENGVPVGQVRNGGEKPPIPKSPLVPVPGVVWTPDVKDLWDAAATLQETTKRRAQQIGRSEWAKPETKATAQAEADAAAATVAKLREAKTAEDLEAARAEVVAGFGEAYSKALATAERAGDNVSARGASANAHRQMERFSMLKKRVEGLSFADAASKPPAAPKAQQQWREETPTGTKASVSEDLRMVGLPHEGVLATNVPVSSIKVDVTRFQQRKDILAGGEGLKKEGGLETQKRWNPGLSQVITVWVDASGQRWLADGHQRLGLAKRMNQDTFRLVDELHEADGWSADMAFVYVAWKNLNVEGDAGWWDAANFQKRVEDATDPRVKKAAETMRAGLKLDALKQLKNPLAIGESIAKLEDSAFYGLEGVRKEVRGAQIKVIADRTAGRWDAATRETAQRKLIEYAARKKPTDIEMAQRVQIEIDKIAKGQQEGIQGNILGGVEEAREDAIAEIRTSIAGKLMTRFRKNTKLLTTAARKGIIEKIKETGGDVDVEGLNAEKMSNEELLGWVELQLTDVGERSPLKNAIAEEAENVVDEFGVKEWQKAKVKEQNAAIDPVIDRFINRVNDFYEEANDRGYKTVTVPKPGETADDVAKQLGTTPTVRRVGDYAADDAPVDEAEARRLAEEEAAKPPAERKVPIPASQGGLGGMGGGGGGAPKPAAAAKAVGEMEQHGAYQLGENEQGGWTIWNASGEEVASLKDYRAAMDRLNRLQDPDGADEASALNHLQTCATANRGR